MNRKLFTARLPKFTAWLKARGAQLLEATNEWELLRFKANGRTSIVYAKADNSLTFTGEAAKAWRSFESSGPWRGCEPVKRSKKSTTEVRALLARDGDDCFLCCKPLGADVTVEHLVAVSHGGPNHLSNKVLMHRPCNERVDHLSVAEKVRLRDQLRAVAT